MTLGERIRQGIEAGEVWEVEITSDCPIGKMRITEGSTIIEVSSDEGRLRALQGIEKQKQILQSSLYKALL